MGLKAIAFGSYKSGKSVFGLSLAEVGPIGLIDTEYRMEWYTTPIIGIPATPPRLYYTNERRVRPTLPFLSKATHPIYLVQTQEVGVAGAAIEAWAKDPAISGIVIDSGSVLWDLLQDTRDESDPKTAMLSWTPVKKTNRRLMYAAMASGKHLLITAHTQDRYKKVGKELVVDGVRPWLEKKTPHWADLTLQFLYPEGAPHPVVQIDGEGVGGQGGVVKGRYLGDYMKKPPDPAPSFAELLKRLDYVPEPSATTPLDPDELEYRNRTTVQAVGGQAAVPEIDGEPGR